MRKVTVGGLSIALLLGVARSTSADEFRCPEGTKDSGEHPGMVVRWCEEESREGRLLYHGPVWRWHRNSQFESKETYVHGKAQGEWPSWYENGKRSSLGLFADGRKAGIWKYWDEAGWLKTEVDYRESGNCRTDFYPSGTRKAIGLFKTSGKIGSWSYWDEAGNIKATCDFGTGVFSVSDDGCRVIVDNLEPKGFSRPLPVANLTEEGHVLIRLGDEGVQLDSPSGWNADLEAGRPDNVPLVFYPKGRAWRQPGPNAYIQPLFKDGRSFGEVLKDQLEEFEDDLADCKATLAKLTRRSDGKRQATLTLSYRPAINTASPFAITASNVMHEKVGLVESSDHVILMIVLTCDSRKQLLASTGAFDALLRSIRSVSTAQPPVASSK